MAMMVDWIAELQNELERAVSARECGNEGRARVCARRAAGIAIREYLTRQGRPPSTASALELLDLVQTQTALPPDVCQAASLLRMRVTETFTLPVQADLIVEARRLCQGLLPDWET